MYTETDKRRLYWLINQYLSGRINASIFEREYHIRYNIEVDHDTLSEKEYKCFGDLINIVGRFSKFEEDHKNYPGVYYTEAEMRAAALKAKEELKEYFEDFEKSFTAVDLETEHVEE